MIHKLFISFTLLLLVQHTFCQSDVERKNRTVYNRFEFFFNTQQTDSIYNLATLEFKNKVPKDDFYNQINYLYNSGKIKEAIPVTFNRGIAGYNLVFNTHKSYLRIGIDSTYKFNFFELNLEPYIPVESKDINANVTKKTTLDFYVDSIAKYYLSNPATSSLSIGLIHGNKTNTFFYGKTNKNDSSSIPTGNTIYEIGSITKLFTAVLLANLVENEIVSLDDSITKFLPDSLKNNLFLQKISFKQLANHTSGLPKLPPNLDKVINFNPNNPYVNYSQKDLFEALKNIQLDSEPGETYQYSELGYGLLGDLISTITKKAYQQNISDEISIPLGMINTFEKATSKTQKLIPSNNEKGVEVPSWSFQALAGSGSLKSTINDLLRFALFQFKMPENKLENALALTRQFTYYLPPNTDIGLGWNMSLTNDVVTYWHNGITGGSSSFIALVPDTKSAVIILSNCEESVNDISTKILDKILNSKFD